MSSIDDISIPNSQSEIFSGVKTFLKKRKTILLPLLIFLFFFLSIVSINQLNKFSIFLMADKEALTDTLDQKSIHEIDPKVKKLERELYSFTPRQAYLLINSSENHFYLYQRGKIIREGLCSTGSNELLKNGDNQQWVFRTPKGEFTIKGKMVSPWWKKPDWAFVEEGLPIPPPNDESRFEYGVLGDYALNIGDGYLIHGTLYQRFIGLPVTHGCVRLGDADLETIFTTLNLGSKVFIY